MRFLTNAPITKEDKMLSLATKNTAVRIKLALTMITISLIGISAPPSQAAETTIEQMPANLETRFALISSLLYPFIDKQGIAEQSYIIQLIGEAEKAKILADEKILLDDLCAYRDVLCLPNIKH
jgi:hypothetical protein